MPNVIKFTGYFAERAEELSVKVDIPKTNSILTAVVGALVGQPEGVRLAALSAMNHMLPFLKHNFANDGERNFIIQRLHDCAVPAIQAQAADGTATAAFPNSPVIRESALECCTRIVELYYEKIDQNYAVAIYHITNLALDLKTNTPYEVMLQAINFWSTLAQVEAHFEEAALAGQKPVSKNLAVASAGTVVPQLLACIHGEGRDYREDDPDTEDDAHNPYTAAAECLKHYSCLLKSDILPHVTPFFGNLRSKDWKARDAALFAFAQVMEGPQENADPSKGIVALIAQCLHGGILDLLQDETSHAVRHSAAFALGRAVKHFPHAVLRVFENPDKFYMYTVQMLDPSRLAAKEPRTVEFFLWALREMVEAVHLKYPDQHILPGTEIIFQALIVTAERPDANQSDLRALSYEVLCDFIRCCSNGMLPYVKDVLLPDLMGRLYNTLSAPQSSAIDANIRSVVLAKLISAVGSIFTRFSMTPKATADLAANLKVPLQDGSSMADTVTKCFLQALPADAELTSGNMCAEEVVLALSQMSKIVGVDFEKYLPVLNPRLLTFMMSIQAGELPFITCTSMGDIVRSIGPQLTRSPAAIIQWSQICAQLIVGDSDPNFGLTTWNSVKSSAIILIGDMVMEIGAQINDQYRQPILVALNYAHEEIKKFIARLSPRIDDSDLEYTYMMIQDTLGLWMNLAQAHKQAQDAQPGSGQVFGQFIPPVIICMTFADGFAQWLTTHQRETAVITPAALLCSCANLMIDSVKCLGPAVAEHLRTHPNCIDILNVSQALNFSSSIFLSCDQASLIMCATLS
jgi:importin subunit beta-1